MKNYKNAVVSLIALIIVVGAATIGYNSLSKKYAPKITELEINPGQTVEAPDFKVLNNDGNSVKLSNFTGKPIIVNFWATWCGPCLSELPAFDSFYKKYKDKIEILMVNLTDGNRDTVESVKDFVSEKGFKFPVYYDTEYNASNTYGVYTIPVTVFIDKNGNIIGIYNTPLTEETLENYAEYLLKN